MAVVVDNWKTRLLKQLENEEIVRKAREEESVGVYSLPKLCDVILAAENYPPNWTMKLFDVKTGLISQDPTNTGASGVVENHTNTGVSDVVENHTNTGDSGAVENQSVNHISMELELLQLDSTDSTPDVEIIDAPPRQPIEEITINSVDDLRPDIGPDHAAWHQVTCYCNRPYQGRPMIECERCKVWLHISCTALGKRRSKTKVGEESANLEFICHECKKGRYSKKRKASGGGSGGDDSNFSYAREIYTSNNGQLYTEQPDGSWQLGDDNIDALLNLQPRPDVKRRKRKSGGVQPVRKKYVKKIKAEPEELQLLPIAIYQMVHEISVDNVLSLAEERRKSRNPKPTYGEPDSPKKRRAYRRKPKLETVVSISIAQSVDQSASVQIKIEDTSSLDLASVSATNSTATEDASFLAFNSTTSSPQSTS